ncbi:MAG: VCBS repeat-containing protein [Clostridia bacterium]|nr:VCBS repeat-containing protein [Clostridia bacterium]
MQVKDSTIAMSSSYVRARKHTKSESLTAWIGSRPDQAPQGRGITSAPFSDRVAISDEARTALAERARGSAATQSVTDPLNDEDAGLDSKTRMAKRIIELLTGIKIETINITKIKDAQAAEAASQASAATGNAANDADWGAEYQSTETTTDTQEMSFEAEGLITTADGQAVRFTLGLSMRSEETFTRSISARFGNAKKVDPIVLNLTGEAAQLTDDLFEFDLNADGATEMISHLRPGSGFLVFDRNGDGAVNDGSELFGPTSGNGMSELSELDTDGSGWIDEGDDAWSQLYVWTRDSAGKDALTTPSSAGVGAIFLGSVDAQFEIKDSTNRTAGELARMGLYLRTDKTVRTVQQVDLVV